MSTSLLNPSTEFAGRHAIVTGGSRGIGAAVAQRLLDAGATVVITARSASDDAPPAATFIAADLRTVAGAEAFASEAVAELGGVDILVNNAGAARPHLGGTAAIPDEEWQDSLDINFLSAVRLTNAVLTPGGDAVREPFLQAMGATPEAVFAQVPLGRAGQPSELAEMVAFLASDRGSWITGHNY